MREKRHPMDVCPYCGFRMDTYQGPAFALPPYSILHGRYLLGRVLGAGGFGITYIAFDMVLERVQAIKEFFVQGKTL